MPLHHLKTLTERIPALEVCAASIESAYLLMKTSFEEDRQLLIAGNGGSAADAEHIAGELMKSFLKPRPLPEAFANHLQKLDPVQGSLLAEMLEGGLRVIPLTGLPAFSTAYLNDVEGLNVFAQQVAVYGRAGDCFLGISTSGNSENIVRAALCAKARGLQVIGLTGCKDSRLSSLCDVCIQVPETETYRIQEMHLPVYHCLCAMLEEAFF